MAGRYSIGVDLGTTNCVVAYCDLTASTGQVQILKILQFVAANLTEMRGGLPSFLYVPEPRESESGVFDIPDHASYPTVNGCYARDASAQQPERTIGAAKSWLCHAGVDRHAAILPWGSDQSEVVKFSPVAASRMLLRQLVDAWDSQFPDDPLSNQTVTLTVPASFDIAARELTREAALGAGLPSDFVLLEEPVAAVYHWLQRSGDDWRRQAREGDLLLVCDVGGGTTDLTLVEVQQEAGELVLRRIAVGQHLLVGGDNMDLALAHFVSQKLASNGQRLNAWQSISLWHACRRAKESLLSDSHRSSETISILGRGSRLIGGTISTEVTRDELQQLLVDGFMPQCSLSDRPTASESSGFQEVGLPFEADTAITRHLAAFLQACSVQGDRPLLLLLNGGVFKSAALSQRLLEVVCSWFGQAPRRLGDAEDLDFAVARGAAYYGWTKQHGGVRVRGGTARSYYVGIESSGPAVPGMPRPVHALCVVPFGMEEGSRVEVPSREVGLVVGKPAKFRFFSAASRQEDQVGTMLRYWDELELVETSPLELTLTVEQVPEAGFVPVKFESRVTELGTLELWCKSSRDEQRWKLEFNVRDEAEVVGQ
jgi:molecular chaperone DnaK (HSP70)